VAKNPFRDYLAFFWQRYINRPDDKRHWDFGGYMVYSQLPEVDPRLARLAYWSKLKEDKT